MTRHLDAIIDDQRRVLKGLAPVAAEPDFYLALELPWHYTWVIVAPRS